MNSVPETIGPYHIVEAIGRGGSGAVYRAHDARLRRDVAIKVLAVEADATSVARLVREASAASRLNHPNILTVHDVAPDATPPYIVTELIDGVTLRQLLNGKPLPAERLLDVAAQIAEGMTAAHQANLVHRDLKPENVMVTREGRVKIVDFGLSRQPSAGDESETVTAPHAVVGTAPYMSPEQARGAALDFRSDLFSFGGMLYEMASGRRPFQRATTIDTLSAILHESPAPLDQVASTASEALRRIIARCLAKRPEERYAATADLLHDLRSVRDGDMPSRHRRRLGRPAVAIAAASLAAAVVAGGFAVRFYPQRIPSAPLSRLLVSVSPAETLIANASRTNLAFSPDGRLLVFAASRGGRQQLYRRSMDRLDAEPIPGTEDGTNPFFSPDGEWVAFWSGQIRNGTRGELKRVRLDGSQPVVIAQAPPIFGGSWGADGSILFGDANGIRQVASAGGASKPIPQLTPHDDRTYRLPQVLPNGRGILFTLVSGRAPRYLPQARIGVMARDGGRIEMLIDNGVDARFVAPDRLVFIRAGTVMVVKFDPERLTVQGEPQPIAAGVGQAVNTGGITVGNTFAGQFAVSSTGTLAYVPATASFPGRRSVKLVDRRGVATTLPIEPRGYQGPRFSRDGRRILLSDQGGSFGFFLYDVSDRTVTPMRSTLKGFWGIWTPDSKSIVFGSDESPRGARLAAVEGESSVVLLEAQSVPAGWLKDGETLAYAQLLPSTQWELRLWSRSGGNHPLRVAGAGHSERYPTFSPDGQWVAYVSDESGRDQVYIERFPGGAERRQVSSAGGLAPAWSPDGRELFYVIPEGEGNALVSTPMSAGAPVRIGALTRLFDWPYIIGSPVRSYDITPDGSRFVVLSVEPTPPPPPSRNIVIVLNAMNAS